MSNKTKILFIGSLGSSFIRKDLELLEKHFDVKVVDLNLRRNIKNIMAVIFNIFRGVLWADLTFSWFAGEHGFWAVRLSKIFKKKSIVVVGGYEVAKVPEIAYGSMLNPKSARNVKFILEKADKILAVSKFNKKEVLKYTSPKNVELVYNGVDCDKFKPEGEKEDLMITIGHVVNHDVKRKRYDIFVKAAKYLPNVKFVLIGKYLDNSVEYLKSIASSNVEFTGFVSDEELVKYYQRAKIYCQLSMYESFGLALAEAMSCECIPVVTDNAALPEIVGDTGFYVPYGDEKATAEAIKEALNSNKGKDARERIENMFTRERREKILVQMIRKVMR